MIRVMDMSTGEVLHDDSREFGEFTDEVLGAQWLTPPPALALGLQTHERTPSRAAMAALGGIADSLRSQLSHLSHLPLTNLRRR